MSTPHLYVLENDLISPTSVTATTEQASRPAANVLDPYRPNVIYAGSGTASSEALVFDLGSATSLECVFVDNPNTAGVTVQGNATDSWGSPSYSAAFPEATSRRWGRERIFCDLRTSSFDTTGYRFLRLTSLGVTSDDATNWKVGGVTLGAVVKEASENFGYPFGLEQIEPTEVLPRYGAPPETSIIGGQRFGIRLSQDVGTSDLDAAAQDLLSQGTGRHVLFYLNRGNLREAFLMQRRGGAIYNENGPRIRSLQNLAFEEVG